MKVHALRDAIPDHCWRPLYRWAVWYIFRDIAMTVLVMMAAFRYIPMIENTFIRYCVWAFYGYVEGLLMTGIWVEESPYPFYWLDIYPAFVGHWTRVWAFCIFTVRNSQPHHRIHIPFRPPNALFLLAVHSPKTPYICEQFSQRT